MPGRGTGTIFKRGGTYYASYAAGGKQRRVSTGTDNREEALTFLNARITEAHQAIVPSERLTVAHLLQTVIEDYTERGLRSINDLTCRVNGVLIPRVGSIRARLFRLEHGEIYVRTRKRDGVAPATIKRELAILKRAFKLAVHREQLIRVPSFPIIRSSDSVREGFLEHDCYRALLAALPEHIQPLFVLGYHVGMRRGALLKLEAGMVDMATGMIRVPGRIVKNARPVMVPIYGDMAAFLSMLIEGKKDKQKLFPSVKTFYKAWAKACVMAGVRGLLFHDLRRTAVRNMSRAGIAEKTIMDIIGHRTRSIFDRYNITSEKDVRQAGEKMERYLAGQATEEGAKWHKQ